MAGALTLACLPSLQAHNEPFTYVRTAQTEAKGEWELEQWITARTGKESGDYLGLDFSTELEYGITDRLQAALYLNSRYHDIDQAIGSSKVYADRSGYEFDGVAGELKYQLADAFTESWGFALYFEPGYSRISKGSGKREDKLFLEFKAIVQKNFFENRLQTAFNYTVEPEWEKDGPDWESALEMEWALGAAWKLNERWHIGLESRLSTEFADADLNDSEFLTLFLGPTLTYGRDTWFASLTVLPQIAGWPDQKGTGGLHLDDKERIEIRVKFGIEF